MTSFEIGKKSNGFERRSLQVLRLIDDDQYFASSTRLLKEHSVQLLVQGDFVTPGNCQSRARKRYDGPGHAACIAFEK